MLTKEQKEQPPETGVPPAVEHKTTGTQTDSIPCQSVSTWTDVIAEDIIPVKPSPAIRINTSCINPKTNEALVTATEEDVSDTVTSEFTEYFTFLFRSSKLWESIKSLDAKLISFFKHTTWERVLNLERNRTWIEIDFQLRLQLNPNCACNFFQS